MTKLILEVASDTGVAWEVRCKQVPLLLARGYTIADAIEDAAKQLRELAVKAAQDRMLGKPQWDVFRNTP